MTLEEAEDAVSATWSRVLVRMTWNLLHTRAMIPKATLVELNLAIATWEGIRDAQQVIRQDKEDV